MADLYGTIEDEDEKEAEELHPTPKEDEDLEGDVAPHSLPAALMPRAHESTVASPLDSALTPPAVAAPTPVLDASSMVASPHARYDAMQAEGSGVSQKHGFGGGLLKALDIAGTIAAPGLMLGVPGSSLNHRLELKREAARENNDLGEDFKQAQTANLNAQPEIKKTQAELAQSKLDQKTANDKSAREIAARRAGYKMDESGQLKPLEYEDMSDKEKAVVDKTNAEKELADAKEEYERTKADPNSPQNKAALKRIQVSAENAATAAGKLGLDKDKYKADYLGLDHEGKPIAGTQTDANGNPIGVRVSKGNEATADRLKRGDLGVNVQDNSAGLRKIITARPDLLGAIAGRFTNVEQMIGNDDPDISKIGVAVHNIALAANGAHGVRSQEAVHDTEQKILNNFHNGPQAIGGALDELDQSVQTFIDEAKLGKKPASSKAENAQKIITTNSADNPPHAADPGMKWQHKTVADGKVQWRQTKTQ